MKFLTNQESGNIIDSVLDLVNTEQCLTVLSPYLTSNEAILSILNKEGFTLTIVINFTIDVFMQKSVELNLLKKLLQKGHKVWFNNKLHSKIYLSSDYIIIGSANFTKSGLEHRQESCIGFQKSLSPSVFKDCEDYCAKVIGNSQKLTIPLIEDVERILASNKKEQEKKDEFEELLPKKEQEQSLRERYEEKYYYPKELSDLSPGLTFDYIDYEKLEEEFNERFPRSQRKSKHEELIAFIQANLYEKNRGYAMKTKLNGKNTLLGTWYSRTGNSFFNHQLKQYQTEFIRDRKEELFNLYLQEYDIEPISGLFSKYKLDLKIDTEAVFNMTYRWHRFIEKIRKIDAFFDVYAKYPTLGQTSLIKYKKEKGEKIPKEIEASMRYENRLAENLDYLKKKFRKKELSPREAATLSDYAEKWGYSLDT